MTSRIRLIITAAVVCHLLVVPPVVTSQLHSVDSAASLPVAPSAAAENDVTFRSLEQEKDGQIYHLRGQAEVHYSTYILYGDEITYDAETGDATADGHVVLD